MSTVTFNPEINYGHLLVLVGIAVAVWQLRVQTKSQGAVFLIDLLKVIYENEQLQRAFYNIEYNKFVYNNNFHQNHNERVLDSLLFHLNLICSLFEKRVITAKEFAHFQYIIERVLENDEIHKYLDWLEKWSKRINLDNHSFAALVRYGIKRGLYSRPSY